jgi:hypothetical protein
VLFACAVVVCLTSFAQCQVCDFDGDNDCDVADIDLFSVVPPVDLRFDINGDGLVDLEDQREWLREAGLENGFAGPLLGGDANLDGIVDAKDLNRIGLHWQIMEGMTWSQGDFDADGRVNAADLMHLGINWQQSVPQAAVSVPEPTSYLLAVLGSCVLLHLVRRLPSTVLTVLVLVLVCLWRH